MDATSDHCQTDLVPGSLSGSTELGVAIKPALDNYSSKDLDDDLIPTSKSKQLKPISVILREHHGGRTLLSPTQEPVIALWPPTSVLLW